MITEDYVSFEVAKLLKEKGFKHWCYKSYGTAVYHKGIRISFDEECDLKSEGLENEIEYVEGGYLYDYGCDNRKKEAKVWAAPTLWEAMKWLREKYGLFIQIWILSEKGYWFNIDKIKDELFNHKSLYSTGLNDIYFPTYEEATENAIKYCLENLI